MIHFIDGAIMIECGVAGLCFLRFWRKSHDRFFLYFSFAFWMMSLNRVSMTLLTPERSVPNESHVLLYLVRLLAFVILLAAIIDKNRAKQPRDAARPPLARTRAGPPPPEVG